MYVYIYILYIHTYIHKRLTSKPCVCVYITYMYVRYIYVCMYVCMYVCI